MAQNGRRHVKKVLTIVLIITGLFIGCREEGNMTPNYFESPEKAVITANELIEKKDWKKLTGYYYLGKDDPALEELVSGRFFVVKDPPPVKDPMGFWEYLHPFPPGFSYVEHQKLAGGNIKVRVSINIIDEPPPGSPPGAPSVMRSTRAFLLRHKPGKGYQFLPEKVEP